MTVQSDNGVTVVVPTGEGSASVSEDEASKITAAAIPPSNSDGPSSSSGATTSDSRTSTPITTTTSVGSGSGSGNCASGWYSCAPSVNGGCCPSGYACGTSDCQAAAIETRPGSGIPAENVGKIAPESSAATCSLSLLKFNFFTLSISSLSTMMILGALIDFLSVC